MTSPKFKDLRAYGLVLAPRSVGNSHAKEKFEIPAYKFVLNSTFTHLVSFMFLHCACLLSLLSGEH